MVSYVFLGLWVELASFPGSPRAQMKNRKEKGEPGKIYHVRNVIGREDLITSGRTNELAHALLILVPLLKLLLVSSPDPFPEKRKEGLAF